MTLHMQTCTGGNGKFPIESKAVEEQPEHIYDNQPKRSRSEVVRAKICYPSPPEQNKLYQEREKNTKQSENKMMPGYGPRGYSPSEHSVPEEALAVRTSHERSPVYVGNNIQNQYPVKNEPQMMPQGNLSYTPNRSMVSRDQYHNQQQMVQQHTSAQLEQRRQELLSNGVKSTANGLHPSQYRDAHYPAQMSQPSLRPLHPIDQEMHTRYHPSAQAETRVHVPHNPHQVSQYEVRNPQPMIIKTEMPEHTQMHPQYMAQQQMNQRRHIQREHLAVYQENQPVVMTVHDARNERPGSNAYEVHQGMPRMVSPTQPRLVSPTSPQRMVAMSHPQRIASPPSQRLSSPHHQMMSPRQPQVLSPSQQQMISHPNHRAIRSPQNTQQSVHHPGNYRHYQNKDMPMSEEEFTAKKQQLLHSAAHQLYTPRKTTVERTHLSATPSPHRQPSHNSEQSPRSRIWPNFDQSPQMISQRTPSRDSMHGSVSPHSTNTPLSLTSHDQTRCSPQYRERVPQLTNTEVVIKQEPPSTPVETPSSLYQQPEALDLTSKRTVATGVSSNESIVAKVLLTDVPIKSEGPLDLTCGTKDTVVTVKTEPVTSDDLWQQQCNVSVNSNVLSPPTDAINYFNSNYSTTNYRQKVMMKSGSKTVSSNSLPPLIRHRSPPPSNSVGRNLVQHCTTPNCKSCDSNEHEVIREHPINHTNDKLLVNQANTDKNPPCANVQPVEKVVVPPSIFQASLTDPQEQAHDFRKTDRVLNFSKYDNFKGNVSIVNPINYKKVSDSQKRNFDEAELDTSKQTLELTAINIIHHVVEQKMLEQNNAHSESDGDIGLPLKRRKSNSGSDCTVIDENVTCDKPKSAFEAKTDKDLKPDNALCNDVPDVGSKRGSTLLNKLLVNGFPEHPIIDTCEESTSKGVVSDDDEDNPLQIVTDADELLNLNKSENLKNNGDIDCESNSDTENEAASVASDQTDVTTIMPLKLPAKSSAIDIAMTDSGDDKDNVHFTHIDDTKCVLEVRCDVDHDGKQDQEKKQKLLMELGLIKKCQFIDGSSIIDSEPLNCTDKGEKITRCKVGNNESSASDIKSSDSDCQQKPTVHTTVKYSCTTCDAVFTSLNQFLVHARLSDDLDTSQNSKMSHVNNSPIISH